MGFWVCIAIDKCLERTSEYVSLETHHGHALAWLEDGKCEKAHLRM